MDWCSGDTPIWQDGDFSPCFIQRYIKGIIPLVFVCISGLWLIANGLYLRKMHSLRRGTLSQTSSLLQSLEQDVIYRESYRESPDWEDGPEDSGDWADESSQLLGGDREGRHRLRNRRRGRIAHGALGKAAFAAALGAIQFLRLDTIGSAWMLVLGVVWGYVAALSLAQALVLKFDILDADAWVTTLIMQVKAFVFSMGILGALELRSLIVAGDGISVPSFLALALLAVFVMLELFLPRLTPFLSDKQTSNIPPPIEEGSSVFSSAFFSYMEMYLLRNTQKEHGLTMDDVPDLRADDKAARCLYEYRQDTQALTALLGYTPSLTPRLIWHFRGRLWTQQVWSFFDCVAVILPPLFLQQLIKFINTKRTGGDAPLSLALLWVAGLFFSQIAHAIVASQALYQGRRIAVRLRSIIICEIFSKALRRSDASFLFGPPAAKPQNENDDDALKDADSGEENAEKNPEDSSASEGKILNLMSMDTFRVSEIASYMHYIFPECIVTIILCLVLLTHLLGWSAFAAVGSILLITPCQYLVSKFSAVFQEQILDAADRRLNLSSEVVAAIRVVKFFAWESRFLSEMNKIRIQELAALYRRVIVAFISSTLMYGAPSLVGVLTFLFHTQVLHRPLTAETAFTALSIVNVLGAPMDSLTETITALVQASTSLRRINAFLNEPETDKYKILDGVQKSSVYGAADSSLKSASAGPVVGFSGPAEFVWDLSDDASFRLSDLDLSFPLNQLSLIVGPVGCGKTTLLSSLLGECHCTAGRAHLPSALVRNLDQDPIVGTYSTAYCSQSPWLMNATIRENILFGAKFNEQRYSQVLTACALADDLAILTQGDLTEVGERGTVLSGGQKARIALARAVYSSARFVLLDDVLSAVDAHTAKYIYEECFKGPLLAHRTTILVTHAVDLCLPGSAFIVALNNGKVVQAGNPADIAKDKLEKLQKQAIELTEPAQFNNSAPREAQITNSTADKPPMIMENVGTRVPRQRHSFNDPSRPPHKPSTDGLESNLVIEDEAAEEEAAQEQEAAEDPSAAPPSSNDKFQLVKEEQKSEGSVGLDVYNLYIKAFGGYSRLVYAVSIFIAAQVADILTSWALKNWANSYDLPAHPVFHALFLPIRILSAINPVSHAVSYAASESQGHLMLVYCAMVGVDMLLFSARMFYFLHRCIVAGRHLYDSLVSSILFAKVRFFDSTPTGRIMNRLSKDMETIDQDLAPIAAYMLIEITSAAVILISIAYTLPAFLIAAVVILAIYYFVGYFYIVTSRDLKRIESITRSPIFSLFGEVLNGVSVIRAYGDSSRFLTIMFSLCNETNRPFFTLWQANRWLSIRVDTTSALVSLAASIVILFTPVSLMTGALAGFILTLTTRVNTSVLWVVRLWSLNEINMNSVERVREYLEIEHEDGEGIHPQPEWPSKLGSIHVQNLSARYAPELPLALHNVSFSVRPGEKIGICGRTGSGKSTLALSFFRFIEAESGRIVIDDLDIANVARHELRSALTIVPQEAVLFKGTLRFNLDPFNQHSDVEVWDALARVQMAPASTSASSSVIIDHAVADYPIDSLDMHVADRGKNFSAGQRQLLSLARGLLKLKHSNILILDESTANLDHDTDERMQKVIRSSMSQATILCIAHRLRTIIDYDKILVLGNGRVLEYDAPWTLLEQSSSAFSDLCRRSGEYDTLLSMAEDARRSKTV